MTNSNNVNLPVIPAKRYFNVEEVCRLAGIRPEQLAEWQQQSGLIGRGGKHFTRLDVIKIRQMQHGIIDNFAQGSLDMHGNPVIGAREVRDELEKMLVKIEKILAN